MEYIRIKGTLEITNGLNTQKNRPSLAVSASVSMFATRVGIDLFVPILARNHHCKRLHVLVVQINMASK